MTKIDVNMIINDAQNDLLIAVFFKAVILPTCLQTLGTTTI